MSCAEDGVEAWTMVDLSLVAANLTEVTPLTPRSGAPNNARRDWPNMGGGPPVIGRMNRTKFLAGLAAGALALTSIGPSFAQSTPALGSWLAGPDGKGASTIVGRVESPRPNQTVNAGANLLVSGWAADLTAAGWAGIDGIEVWNGAKDKN